MKTEQDKSFDVTTIDAQKWAKEFVRLNSATDEGTMLAWFASAIMAGVDSVRREQKTSLWTDAPTDSGYYFVENSLERRVVQFIAEDRDVYHNSGICKLKNFQGWSWCGPILEPQSFTPQEKPYDCKDCIHKDCIHFASITKIPCENCYAFSLYQPKPAEKPQPETNADTYGAGLTNLCKRIKALESQLQAKELLPVIKAMIKFLCQVSMQGKNKDWLAKNQVAVVGELQELEGRG